MAPFQVYEFAFACCSIAAVALLIWDHAITFGAEVRALWMRKLSGSTVLYAMMRYGTLFEKVTVLLLASWYMTPRGCNIAVRVQIFPMLVRTLGFGLFSSLRVYALTAKNWRLALLVFALCLPSAIMPSYVYTHQWAQSVDRYGCGLAYLASPTTHDRLRISGIAADILSESIVIGVTLSKTLWLAQTGGGDMGKFSVGGDAKPGLGLLLLRNGCIYFVALLVLSLADMLVLIFDHLPAFATRYDYWVVPYYTPVFRTIIICRFLLMLRNVYYTELDAPGAGAGTETENNSLRFASRVIGTMGAPVDAGLFDNDDVQLEEDDLERASVYASDPMAAGLAIMIAEADKKLKAKEECAPGGSDGSKMRFPLPRNDSCDCDSGSASGSGVGNHMEMV